MLCEKLFIGVRRIGGASALPLPILRQLRDARAGFGRKLAVGVPVEKFAVAIHRVRRLRGTPVLLLAAASAEQSHRDQ
jgi:hypothetical protein